jgi:hypothetical protein
MAKPCKISGKFAIGISTLTMRGRRAIQSPITLDAKPPATTQAAEALVKDSGGPSKSNTRTPSSNTSRSRVNTNTDEKNPMARRPIQIAVVANQSPGRACWRTERGMSTQAPIKTAIPKPAPTGPVVSDGSSRQPT